MRETTFERYCWFTKVSQVVMSFYGRILDSPLTSPFFNGIDMKRLIDHQVKFLAALRGISQKVPVRVAPR